MRRIRFHLLVLLPLVAAGACAPRASTAITAATGADTSGTPTIAGDRSADTVRLTDADITERKYRSLGDITVTLSKWTMFSADPTRAEIDEKLKEKAAALGADAVILVRYGSVGISAFSYGQLKGSGRAVAFVR